MDRLPALPACFGQAIPPEEAQEVGRSEKGYRFKNNLSQAFLDGNMKPSLFIRQSLLKKGGESHYFIQVNMFITGFSVRHHVAMFSYAGEMKS